MDRADIVGQHDAAPEHGDGQSEDGHGHQQVVQDGVALNGADDAHGDADDHGDQDAEDHDQNGGLQAVADVLHHRQVVVQGVPRSPWRMPWM